MTAHQPSNRLAHEKSPYLLQHAHNPVDWYPWGDEAFARAAAEGKPVFLSIGYATCHWCHVMERESFEDEGVARLLNADFVCIKVDREERPDIDSVYMAVCQAVTGSGGWPLTIVMTPDKAPFFAATYLPRHSQFGQIGLKELLPRLVEYWRDSPAEALDLAARIRQTLDQPRRAAALGAPDETVLRRGFEELLARYDSVRGGFGRAPKFPAPPNLMFLLRYWRRSGDARALQMVEHALQAMRAGGVYDQIGFGLHRYSTDARWLVPHFEKMLYDQALLVLAALEAFQATGDVQYATLARETLAYVSRDMTSAEGAFYSAEDADSEGVEGKFYVWAEAEIREVLGPDLADLAIGAYGVEPQGNFHDESSGDKTHTNILHLPQPPDTLAHSLGLDPAELRNRLEEARELLLARRLQRVRPLLDDKVLADWNGLMIAACARAAWVLNEPGYLTAAGTAADFILTRLRDSDGRLLHRFREGEAAIPAFLDDYAFLAWGLLELYESGFDPAHLAAAKSLVDLVVEHFRHPATGAFTLTAAYHEPLLLRPADAYDGALPSGNSVMLLNLLRLSRLLGLPEYEQRAGELMRGFSVAVAAAPAAHAHFLSGLDMALSPGQEILITGGAADDRRGLLDALRPLFLPATVTVELVAGTAPGLLAVAPWLAAYPDDGPAAAAYVCVGRACHAPVPTPAELVAQLTP